MVRENNENQGNREEVAPRMEKERIKNASIPKNQKEKAEIEHATQHFKS